MIKFKLIKVSPNSTFPQENFLTYFTEQLQSNTELLLEQALAFCLVLSQAPRDKSKMEAETADTTKMLPSEDYI